MKELPILFSSPMVRAIIEGRKKETRRMRGLKRINAIPGDWDVDKKTWKPNGDFIVDFINKHTKEHLQVKCPYGSEGDMLYVRETWQHTNIATGLSLDDANSGYIYKESENGRDWENNTEGWTWRPSIFMLKKAARIWLEIESTGIDRLHNITEDDALDEGVEDKGVATGGDDYEDYYRNYLGPQEESEWPWISGDPIASFKSLWISINGPESWEANPWVWVVKFKVLSTAGRPGKIS